MLSKPALYLLCLFFLAVLMAAAISAYMHFAWPAVAPQFTSNPTFNQKVLFLRKRWPTATATTVIVGSSQAINNFDSDYLQAYDRRPVLNLGADGLSLAEDAKLLTNVENNFPVQKVIMVLQFNELRDGTDNHFALSPSLFARYVQGKVSWIEEFSYRDLQGFLNIVQHRKTILNSRTTYSSADFTETGAVPLEIYGAQIDSARWNGIGLLKAGGCAHCLQQVRSMCEDVTRSGRQFILVAPPISPYIGARRPDIVERYDRGRQIMSQLMSACHGALFDIGAMASLDDDCFADFEHLNARGARAVTQLFVQGRQPGAAADARPISCQVGGSPQSLSS